jgi:hypothetical protein
MGGNFFLAVVFCAVLGLSLECACTKTGVIRQLNSLPGTAVCDTCSAPLQIDKEVILYLDSSNWVDRTNGKFDCDLSPLLAVSANPIDSFSILAIYVGLGRSGRKIIQATPVSYDSGTLAWFGFLLSFQGMPGQKAPQSLAIRVQLEWI